MVPAEFTNLGCGGKTLAAVNARRCPALLRRRGAALALATVLRFSAAESVIIGSGRTSNEATICCKRTEERIDKRNDGIRGENEREKRRRRRVYLGLSGRRGGDGAPRRSAAQGGRSGLWLQRGPALENVLEILTRKIAL